MRTFIQIGYFIVGLAQFFAVWDGLAHFTGFWSGVAFIIALFVTYIPLVGSLFGVYGAVAVWSWTVTKALILFFWYVPVAFALTMLDRR